MDGGAGNPKNALSREAIVRVLFETYESLYDIDAETSAYQCYHESDSFSRLGIESGGDDFFRELRDNVEKTIFPEDQDYVRAMLDRRAVLDGVRKERYYSFVYRLMLGGQPVHHKIRATLETVNGRPHILLGVRNVEETIRQEQAHTSALASMHQKERNHMEAILASAAGYLEADLTLDRVLECSPFLQDEGGVPGVPLPDWPEPVRYTGMERWLAGHMVSGGAERYAAVSDRAYLLECFARGERRASVRFSTRTREGEDKPCRKVFYLYQDHASGNVMAFCVIYDLTEQQRRERETQELEDKLRMSRIRNFTSQMQPHFLYNALGSIQEVMLDDPEYASELIGDFTTHLRSCIRAMSSDAPLPFEQELANIRAYVNIEKMRFGRRLRVAYEIGVTDFSILPLSIQPLVENAIRHGVYRRGAAGGQVTVRTRQTPEAWIVEVEDDGVGFDPAAVLAESEAGERDSTGLKNLIFRLDHVMRAAVDIRSAPGQGTKVTVTVPKGGISDESRDRG